MRGNATSAGIGSKPFRPALLLVLTLAWLLPCGSARAQNVILRLRNGDRIAGTIVSENTNQVVISTVWIKELPIPVSQIERREPAPALATTNAPAKAGGTNTATVVVLSTQKTSPPLANTNTFWSRWKGDVSLGMDMERGALNHQLYYGRAKLTYAQPYQSDPKEFFRNILTYDAEYGKTDGTLSDNRMGGSSKTDFDLNRKVYVYNLGAASHDEIRKIDLHYEDGPGVGYHWINHTNFIVNLELGANYQVEDRSDGTHTRSAYGRFGEDLTWKINKQMSLTQKFEYFPRFDSPSQYRMRFESNLSYALLLNLSLNLTVVDLYDTQPTAGVPSNDFQLRTSLGIKF